MAADPTLTCKSPNDQVRAFGPNSQTGARRPADWIKGSEDAKLIDARLRKRRDEPPALQPIGLLLPHNLLTEVPGEDQHRIGAVFKQCADWSDGKMRSGGEPADFAFISVHRERNGTGI